MAIINGVEVKLRPEVKKRWLKALRSGKYEQTTGTLCEPDSKGKPQAYCCLGVLCDIHRQSRRQKGDKWEEYDSSALRYHGADGLLPEKVINWAFTSSTIAGLEAEGEDPKSVLEDIDIPKAGSLAELNDEGKSFKEIATVIEKHL